MKRAALVLAMVLAVPAWVGAQTAVDQKRPAPPDGAVSIENMAGSVKVTGWDRAEVQVKGTVGAGGKLTFDGTGKRTHIEIEGFQATISVVGVTGSVRAETVNGSITQAGAAKQVELQSVNGDVDVTKAGGRVKAESVNGSVVLHDASGELEASTVHGKLQVLGGSYERAELESVAGTVRFDAALSPRAALSIETVSGEVELSLAAGIGADFAVSSFSGRISNELGPAAVKSGKWTPQTELNFTTGSGGVRVKIETLSGSVNIRKRP